MVGRLKRLIAWAWRFGDGFLFRYNAKHPYTHSMSTQNTLWLIRHWDERAKKHVHKANKEEEEDEPILGAIFRFKYMRHSEQL